MAFEMDWSLYPWATSPDDVDRYEALCSSIEQNDPTCTEIASDLAVPFGYGLRLGQALQGNTRVSIFYIKIRRWMTADLPTMQATAADESVTSLLHFLRDSESLRQVHLNSFPAMLITPHPSGVHLTDLVLRALAVNSHLTHFSVDYSIIVEAQPLSDLIATTTSITTMNLTISGWFEGPLFRIPLAAAFGLNQSLLVLTLNHCTSTMDIVTLILHALERHSKLLNLTLIHGTRDEEVPQNVQPALFMALASFLQHAVSLQALSLQNYIVAQEDVESLSTGLHASTSLRHLTIAECTFDIEATIAFLVCLRFTTAPAIDAQSTLMVPASLTIEKLSLLGTNEMFQNMLTGQVAVLALLLPAEPDTETGSRSSLKVLELEAMAGFSDVLVTAAAQFRLPRLEVKNVVDNCDELVQCLPLMIHQKELELPAIDDVPTRRRLVKALRKNGSLLNVMETCNDGSRVVFLPSDPRDQDSYRYRLRNQGISSLRQKADGSMVDEADDIAVEQLFPAYFQSGQAAPRTAPNVVHMGLLAMPQDAPEEA